VEDKAKMEEYEEMRDAASKLNLQMIDTLEKCTVENMEETIRMCHAVASVSDNPTFLNREAQVNNLLIYSGMLVKMHELEIF